MERCRSQKDLDGAICVTLSVDKSEQLMKIGTSADLGKCKALRKDGLPCTMYTNKCESKPRPPAVALRSLSHTAMTA